MQPKIITEPKILDVDIFDLNGETVNRVIMEINGHTVQVLSYDNNPNLIVDIDNRTGAQVHILDLDEYIAGEIG